MRREPWLAASTEQSEPTWSQCSLLCDNMRSLQVVCAGNQDNKAPPGREGGMGQGMIRASCFKGKTLDGRHNVDLWEKGSSSGHLQAPFWHWAMQSGFSAKGQSQSSSYQIALKEFRFGTHYFFVLLLYSCYATVCLQRDYGIRA